MLGAAEKNKEKVKAICTGFSVLVSQSVEFSFSGKTKIQMLTTFAGVLHCPSMAFLNPLDFIESLGSRLKTESFHSYLSTSSIYLTFGICDMG